MQQNTIELIEQDDPPREEQQTDGELAAGKNEPVHAEPADQHATSGSSAPVSVSGERMVPVSEAKRYRKRAQAAETMIDELKQQLAANEAQIRSSESLLAAMQRRLEIDDLLIECGSLDMESARALVEQSLADREHETAEAAVNELQRRKPALFRGSRCTHAAAQAARNVNGQSLRQESLLRAAVNAGETGQRHDVMQYLRLRRRH